jgi:hypothetical protein
VRHRQLNNAIDCKEVDVGLASTPKGPRIVIMPMPHEKAIRPATYALDVASAKTLAANLLEFIRRSERNLPLPAA